MEVKVNDIAISNERPIVFMAGPCVVESEEIVFTSAEFLKRTCEDLKIPFIFKSSFMKANRSSIDGFSTIGFDKALAILAKVKQQLKVPIITDVHEYTPMDEVAEVADVLQTPAFLCRQTQFLEKVAKQNKPINVKKGQFLSPYEVKNVVTKLQHFGNSKVMLCERGFSFGYQNLVVDMRSLEIMKRDTGCPVIFDAGHSVQSPGGKGNASGGDRSFIVPLARAAVGVGVAGIFLETHPNPEKALSDGPNMLPLKEIPALLQRLKALDEVAKSL